MENDLTNDYSKNFLGLVNSKNTQTCIQFLKLNLQNSYAGK